MLQRNMAIEWVQPITCEDGKVERKCIHRVVGFTPDRKQTALVQMEPKSPRLRILVRDTSHVEKLIEEAKAHVVKISQQIVPPTPALIEYRNLARRIMDPFIRSTDFLFDCHLRSDMVKKAAETGKTNEPRVRRMLESLCFANMSISGMERRWSNCGRPRKGYRFLKKMQGRPDKLGLYRHLITGRPLTDEDHEKFERGLKDFYFGHSKSNFSLKRAHRLTLLHYYREKVEIRPGFYETRFEQKLPKLTQFRDYLETKYTPEEIARLRQTAAQFGTHDRKRQSESETLTPFGPGDIYQIDSTTADIYLVMADGSRKVIGRPTLYQVIDVWSRMIVGFHLTLRSSRYDEMILALLSVVEDKKALCERWGVEYREEEWPLMPLPTTLIGDRQELIYGNSDLLFDYGIEIENTPPYRGDFKALVEQAFGHVARGLWTRPGAVTKDYPMDLPDYRQDAIYTFDRIGYLLLQDVIMLNRRQLENVPVPVEYTGHSAHKRPIDLARWGREHISGCGFEADYDDARRELLPYVDSASITKDGLRVSVEGVKALYYHIPKGSLPKHLTGSGKWKKADVQYDSRSVNTVWLRHPETSQMIPCTLKVRTFREYEGWSFPKAAAWQKHLQVAGIKIDDDNTERQFQFYLNELAASEAALKSATSQPPSTRSGITEGMSENRQKEHETHLGARRPIVDGEAVESAEERF